MNSTVLDPCLSKGYVEIKCQNNHRFIISYTKNHTKTWCEQCKITETQNIQQAYKEREKSEDERKLREQRKLFEESQRLIQKEQQKTNRYFNSQEEAIYFEQIMKQICSFAKTKMEREM